MIMTRGNRAKSIANNQRTLCKNHRKMKETGKSLGKIDCKCKKTLKTQEEAVETAGNMITIRGNRTKSLGKRRKPERMLGTNHDDAVKMLEKYSKRVGKRDNNQRKWSKDYRKMKETGKTLGNIH